MERVRRKSAGLAAARLACAAIPDANPRTPKIRGLPIRRPQVGDTVFVWDITWQKRTFDEGTVHESPALGTNSKKFNVHFKDKNVFDIPFKTTRKTHWTLNSDDVVPQACLKLLDSRISKLKKNHSERQKKKASRGNQECNCCGTQSLKSQTGGIKCSKPGAATDRRG